MQRVALRARTILLDTAIAGAAFAAAYHISPPRVLGAIPGPHSLTLLQLVALYAALAAGFSLLFRRELSPWRYTSIPDAAVLARVAVLTVGVFLVWVFVLDRASSLPRSTLFLAPFLQMTGTMGVRILRRALHEHVLGSFAPFNTLSDRTSQGPHLLLVGPPAAADSYLRDVARNHDRNWSPVGAFFVTTLSSEGATLRASALCTSRPPPMRFQSACGDGATSGKATSSTRTFFFCAITESASDV